MTNLSSIFCLKVRDARRAAGLTQHDLAMEVGCKQSALSMFEQGDGTKLNDAVIAKIAKKFELEIAQSSAADDPVPVVLAASASGFCPNPHCPSNTAYSVDGRALYRPDRELADPVGGKYCALCGELLERHCPNCAAMVHAGAICSFCGEAYVAKI